MSKLLLVDNYDSFTFNIVNELRNLKITFQVVSIDKISTEYAAKFSKIIISPGPGTPNNFPKLGGILSSFYKQKPILGICLGCQSIALYFGAKLRKLDPVFHGQRRKIYIFYQCPLFKDLPEKFYVGLYHSWCVQENSLPSSLKITAISEDGIIMGISHSQYRIFGVQFHPESYMTDFGTKIIQNFLDM